MRTALIASFACALAACPPSEGGPPSDLDQSLIEAAVKKDLEGVKAALAKGANPNVKADLLAKGPPIVSLARLDKAFTAALVEKGADVNLAREDGDTALITASIAGNLEVVTMLLEKGADVNAKNLAGYTAVSEAVHKGEVEIARLLVEKGADLTLGGAEGGLHIPFDRALGKATRERDVEKERVEIVKLIVEKAPPDQTRLDQAVAALAAWRDAGPNVCAIARLLVEKGGKETDPVKAFLAKCPAAAAPPAP